MQKAVGADSRKEFEVIGGKWTAGQARGHLQQDARVDQLEIQTDQQVGGHGLQTAEADPVIEQQPPDVHSSLFGVLPHHQPADHPAQVSRDGESHPQEGAV